MSKAKKIIDLLYCDEMYTRRINIVQLMGKRHKAVESFCSVFANL